MPDPNVTIEDVAKSLSDLSTAVTDLKSGLIDETTVERIAQEALTRSNAAARSGRTEGFTPEDVDVDGNTVEEKIVTRDLKTIHTRNAGEVAQALRGTSEDDVRHFQRASDTLLLLGAMTNTKARDLKFYEQVYKPALRAVNTNPTNDPTYAHQGDDWLPQTFSSSLIERIQMQLRVADLFNVVQMTGPEQKIPGFGLVRRHSGLHVEQIKDNNQEAFKLVTPESRAIWLRAKKFAARALTSKEAEEDLIIDVLAFLEDEIVDYIRADIEDCLINGDDTPTHFDPRIGAPTGQLNDPHPVDYYLRAWKGLRWYALNGDANLDMAGAPKVASLTAARAAMGRYATTQSDLVHITSLRGYIALLADENVLTADRYGSGATILTGELGKAAGIPIVVSEFVPDNLDAAGHVPETGGDRSAVITVNPKGFMRGVRRNMTVQRLVEAYAEVDQDAVIASTREAFTERYPGEPLVMINRNVDVGL